MSAQPAASTHYQPDPEAPPVSAKLAMLFDFYDKFGQLSWAEQRAAVRYTAFPYPAMLWCNLAAWALGWLYLAGIGLYKPALLLLLGGLMLCLTFAWWSQSLAWLWLYLPPHLWAAARARYWLYLLYCHDYRAWW